MTSRDRSVLAAVLAVLLVVGAWLLFIQPRRDQAGRLASQITAARTQLGAAEASVATGLAAKAAFLKYQRQLNALTTALPSDDNIPALINEIQGAAAQNRVDFHALSVGTSGGSSTAPAAASTAATPTLTTPLPPGVTLGSAGIPTEGFSFTFNGSYFDLANLLGRLQKFVRANNKKVSATGRLLSINSVSLAPGATAGAALTASITASTYLVPGVLTPAIP
jgi:Tfp pilus assembly protein PilO